MKWSQLYLIKHGTGESLKFYEKYNISNIIIMFMLAGEFGVVYRATLNGWGGRDAGPVAVKTLKGNIYKKYAYCPNCSQLHNYNY